MNSDNLIKDEKSSAFAPKELGNVLHSIFKFPSADTAKFIEKGIERGIFSESKYYHIQSAEALSDFVQEYLKQSPTKQDTDMSIKPHTGREHAEVDGSRGRCNGRKHEDSTMNNPQRRTEQKAEPGAGKNILDSKPITNMSKSPRLGRRKNN